MAYNLLRSSTDACNQSHGTMAAVLALADEVVEDICTSIDGIVVAANYNCPGQLVISGEIPAVETACEKLKEKGAKRALILPVGGVTTTYGTCTRIA